ncbi:hypothetical protein Aperf_G00000014564 [Anoplocephala perfoliata]
MDRNESFDIERSNRNNVSDELSGASDTSVYSEKSEVVSIGQLQHELKMLSIRVLEKDIEIKNLKATAAATGHFKSVSDQDKLSSHSNNDQISQTAEVDILRKFLIEHDFTNPHQTFMAINDYDQINQRPITNLSLIDLVKFRYLQLCLSLQKMLNASSETAKSLNSMGVQTEKSLGDDLGAVSLEKYASFLKQDNDYLAKQFSVLEEKLHYLERTNQTLVEDLTKAGHDRTSLLERAVKAEESLQSLQKELQQCQESYENRLPLGLFEQLRLSEVSRRERETTELNKELIRLRAERTSLTEDLRTAEVEIGRLREDLQSVSSRLENFANQPPDILKKTRIVSLEVQLNAANAARNDALRQVEKITQKFEAASKAVHELDATRKVEVSRLEAQLSVASHKLAAYEQLESELDRAIEQFAPANEHDGIQVVTELFPLTNITNKEGAPLLPTLASRRLEHCIKLSRRIARAEEVKGALQTENEGLKRELEIAKEEAKRVSELLANMNKPTNGLAAALVARDRQISSLQSEKRRLEEKMRKLFDCTKDILVERNAMLADLNDVCNEMKQQQSELGAAQILKKQLPRKIHTPRP